MIEINIVGPIAVSEVSVCSTITLNWIIETKITHTQTKLLLIDCCYSYVEEDDIIVFIFCINP